MTNVYIPSESLGNGIRATLNAIEPRRSIDGEDNCAASSVNFTTESLARKRLTTLSRRETEVLNLVVSGLTNRATSIRLGISTKTVEKHRGNLMKKLGVQHLPDLMRIWLQAHPEELTTIR
ncbi:MAG: LuxR C-terminal-related transcriptional regulator [Fuerstiella sp.]